ncbi:piggyBac transposable element-derived protein 3-like [Spodoptera litura]|uniref:PiggyBac transposable element-derived protein 3-like n=1 Tax=Spodoptera litura TaxID=69820 RepID=A0A9J7IQ80_SPOLT|nr:piggyBac transposable element-derived protein 3-like [Spodoptera litura]
MKYTVTYIAKFAQKLETRGGRILALVPAHNAPSDDSEPSDIEDEIPEHAPLSMSSSSAPSIESSLERLNLFNDEQEPTNDNVRLTSIFQTVYSSPSLEPNCNKVPILSDIPSFPATPASPVTPATPTNSATASLLARSASFGLETPRMPANATSTSLFSRTTRSQRSTIRGSVAQRPRRIQKYTLSYRWKKAVFRHLATMEEESDSIGDATIQTPLEYFYKFFSPDILTHILEQSNAYAVSKTGRTLGLTEDELRDFIAIHIIMGVVSMPSYTDYWSLRYRYKLVADLMPLKRYQQIRRYLHFVDNNIEDSDRYYKIRPLVQKIRENCLAQENERRFSIDEMMIPYKGTKAGKRRQYMKDKPNKWGFKNYVRAGVSGMIYDFILYGGEDTFRFHTFSEQEASIGFGAQVVIALCKTIKSKPAFVFCDNFFSCPELFYILREEYGIFGLGTIRNNRLRGAEASLPSEKEMKKKPRGSHAQATCNKNRLAVVRWHDNKAVTLISSYVGVEPVGTIKRYCKDSKTKVDVQCPQIVKEYNKHMGGVDLADMLISLYRTPFKTRRWYIGIFAQLLDICINNAWLLHRKDSKSKSMPLKDFRFELYEGLTKYQRSENGIKGTKKRVPQASPAETSRYDNIFGSPGVAFMRRRVGEEFKPECVFPTVKHGGDSIMIWG